MRAVLVLSLRALSGWKRLLVLGLLMAVPVALAAVFYFSQTDEDGTRFAIELFDNVVLPVLMPLTAVVVASSALGHEIEDHTLIYLILRPVPRTFVVLAKYLAAALIVTVLVEISVSLTIAIASQKTLLVPPGVPQGATLLEFDRGNTAIALLLAGFGGSVAYVALFLLVGLLMPQHGLLVGFVYVLGWEGLAAGLSTALATLSIRRYAQGILDTHLNSAELAQVIPSTLSSGGSVLGLAIVVAAALSLSTWRLTRMQLT